jgi:putative addiction module component (TIGR02574 family)
MNKRLSEALSRISELPDDRQEAAAELLLDFVEHPEAYELTPEQLAEIERRLDDDDYASPEEVEAFFARFKA